MRSSVGWQHVQHHALNAGAVSEPPSLKDGDEFVFVGDPVFIGDCFMVNVFTFDDGLVKVLSGDGALARRCLGARLRRGPLAVFAKKGDEFDFVEHLSGARLDYLPTYDLEALYVPDHNQKSVSTY